MKTKTDALLESWDTLNAAAARINFAQAPQLSQRAEELEIARVAFRAMMIEYFTGERVSVSEEMVEAVTNKLLEHNVEFGSVNAKSNRDSAVAVSREIIEIVRGK